MSKKAPTLEPLRLADALPAALAKARKRMAIKRVHIQFVRTPDAHFNDFLNAAAALARQRSQEGPTL